MEGSGRHQQNPPSQDPPITLPHALSTAATTDTNAIAMTANPASPSLPPPDYHSVAGSAPNSQSQIDRNREKQALRDAWARQGISNSERTSAGPHYAQPPPSVDPNSSNSNSNSNSIPDNHSPATETTRIPAGAGAGLGFGHTAIIQSPESLSGETPTTPAPTSHNRNSSGYLPPGMDVREALARCEDPTLGWSLQFWVTIADPVTQHVFFACPASGQCSWDPPIGAFVVPRSADGEWWELADATRSNRSYYYNTLTGKTQWTRPIHDAFVIPLGLIQRNALPARSTPSNRRSSGSGSNTHQLSISSLPSRENQPPSTPTRTRSGPHPPPTPSPRATPGRSGSGSGTGNSPVAPQSPPLLTPTLSFPEAVPTGHSPPLSFGAVDQRNDTLSIPWGAQTQRTPLSIVEENSGNDTDRSERSGTAGSGSGSWWDRRKSKAITRQASPKRGKGKARAETVAEDLTVQSGNPNNESLRASTDVEGRSNGDGGPVLITGSTLPRVEPPEPVFVESSVRTKRMSTGLHPLLPPDISSEIQNFQATNFASKYFATKRSGVLRSRVPLERIMEWQKNPITSPLLVLSRSSAKDAITTFKVIQHVMGERDRPVENTRRIAGSSSSMQLPHMGRKDNNGAINGYGSSGHADANEKTVVLEEIRWMNQLAVSAAEMRDEIYSQLIKQLTNNPDHESVVLGFQLFCVLINAFSPSKNFEVFVKSFLKNHNGQGTDGITIMAKYCVGKLDTMIAKGSRGRVLTLGEIEHASDAAFYPSVYGESLDRIMELQARSYPSLQIPVILPFLADGILALGGLHAEGIFRVPGDNDSISELKSRMDRGHYQLQGIDDPHVAASLFKLWLRELEEPVVPTNLYNAALTASKSTTESLDFVLRLPAYHRRVLLFVISFAQLFLKDEVVEITKMTPSNLALVLAPNILRTESNHLVTVFTNSSFESKFVLQLLENMRPGEIDPEYIPTHGKAAGVNGVAAEARRGSGGANGDGNAKPRRRLSEGVV